MQVITVNKPNIKMFRSVGYGLSQLVVFYLLSQIFHTWTRKRKVLPEPQGP